MKINWDFMGGGTGVQNKKPSVGEVWIFSGTARLNKHISATGSVNPNSNILVYVFMYVGTTPWCLA